MLEASLLAVLVQTSLDGTQRGSVPADERVLAVIQKRAGERPSCSQSQGWDNNTVGSRCIPVDESAPSDVENWMVARCCTLESL